MIHRQLVLTIGGLVCASALVLAGCGSDDDADEPMSTELEVTGSWESEFGPEEISSDAWNEQEIVAYDNATNTAITHSSADAEFNPDTYSRLVWTEIEADSFFYCTADYGLETLEAAQSSSTAVDASDPETSGCGTFPWTKLTRSAR